MPPAKRRAPKPRAKAVKDKQPRAKKKHEADAQIPMTKEIAVTGPTKGGNKIPPTQAGMFDHELTSGAMYDLIVEKHRLSGANKAYNKVQKEFRESFKTLCKEMGIKDGARIRIISSNEDDPPYAMAAKLRKGGGHSVETWESLGAVDIHKLPVAE